MFFFVFILLKESVVEFFCKHTEQYLNCSTISKNIFIIFNKSNLQAQ